MTRRPLLLLLLALPAACSSNEEEGPTAEDFLERAVAYYDDDDLLRALQQASRGLELEPDDGMLNLVMGRALLRKRDLNSVNAAQTYLEKANEEIGDWRTELSLGESHLRYAQFLIGEASLLENRRLELSEGDPEALKDLDERALHAREVAQKHLDQALPLLESAQKENPSATYPLQLLASAYAVDDRKDEALAALDELIAILQESRRWKNRELARQELNIVQEEELRRLLREDLRQEVESLGLKAALLMSEDRFEDAETSLTEALHLNPDLGREYYNRGICRYREGRLLDAASDMEIFLRKTELSFESEQVQRAMEILDQYRAAGQPGRLSVGAASAESRGG